MARVTDKSLLNEGTEYSINFGTKRITVSAAGNVSSGAANGVTGLALYSAIADWWKSQAGSNDYRFPLFIVDGPIGSMLELRFGWEFTDSASIALIRSMGFAYKDTSGTITAEYACFVQGGTIANSADQPYYLLGSDTVPTNFGVPDAFNECIQVYGDASHGNFDKRSAAYIYERAAGETYGYYDLVTSQSLSSLTYRSYLIPMTTTTDPNISVTAPSGSPYSGMTLTLGATTNTINSTVYNFAEGEIDANGGTVQQVYDWFQDLLLKTTDIDSGAGTQRGDTYATGSLTFVGGIITTSQGLTIKNIAPSDKSNIIHTDDTGAGRQEAVTATASVTGMPTTGTATRLQVVNETGRTAASWAASTAYSVGDKVLRTTGVGTENTEGLFFVCTTAGTSGATEPTWDTTVGNTTSDGTAVWTTRAVQVYSSDPASATWSLSYTDGDEFSSGDTVRIRFAQTNGGTSFVTFSQNAVAATSGWSVVCDEVSDTVYAANAIDGSTITKFSANFAADTIELVVAANFTAAEAYAFYCYQLTTADGISQFWGGVIAADVGNYKVVTSVLNLYFDNNTTATQRQTDTARIYRDDGVYPIKDPTTTGYGIDINWKNVVYVQNVGGSALTSAESAALFDTQSKAATAAAMSNIIETNGSITAQQALSILLAAQVGEYDAATDVFKDHTGTDVRIDSSSTADGSRGPSTLTPSS